MSDMELHLNEDSCEDKRLGRFVLLILNAEESLILIDSSLMCLVNANTIQIEAEQI
jgi:hypothetical protein